MLHFDYPEFRLDGQTVLDLVLCLDSSLKPLWLCLAWRQRAFLALGIRLMAFLIYCSLLKHP